MLAQAMGIIYVAQEEREIKEKRDKETDVLYSRQKGAEVEGVTPLTPDAAAD